MVGGDDDPRDGLHPRAGERHQHLLDGVRRQAGIGVDGDVDVGAETLLYAVRLGVPLPGVGHALPGGRDPGLGGRHLPPGTHLGVVGVRRPVVDDMDGVRAAGLSDEGLEAEPQIAGILVVGGHEDRDVQRVELALDAGGESAGALQVVHDGLEHEQCERNGPHRGEAAAVRAAVVGCLDGVLCGPGRRQDERYGAGEHHSRAVGVCGERAGSGHCWPAWRPRRKPNRMVRAPTTMRPAATVSNHQPVGDDVSHTLFRYLAPLAIARSSDLVSIDTVSNE